MHTFQTYIKNLNKKYADKLFDFENILFKFLAVHTATRRDQGNIKNTIEIIIIKKRYLSLVFKLMYAAVL